MPQPAESRATPAAQPHVPGSEHRPGRAALIVFLVLWAVWSGLLGWLRTSAPELNHGDITTDANILNAGENFDREGFWNSWGVPSLDTFRTEGTQPDHYLTYPPGSYWLHQTLKALGVRELWHFRLVAVFWSSLAVLLFFILCTRVSGAVLPAAIAAAAYMFSRPFVEYADNLHYLALSQVTLFATLSAWVGVEQAETARGRMRWLLVAAAMFAIDSLVTFEHTLFIAAFGLVRIVLSRRWRLLIPLMLLGLVPIAVLAFRMGINAAAMGSFGEVWANMEAKLRQRTGASGTVHWSEFAHELLDRLGWRPARSGIGSDNSAVRIGVLAPAFLAPACMLAVISLATWHLEGMRSARKALGFAFAMLIGGATWHVVMREHANVHQFTILLLLPGIAALIGALVTFGWWQWRLQPRGAPVRLAGLIAGSVLLTAHVSQLRHAHALNLRWRLDAGVFEHNRNVELFETRFSSSKPAFSDTERLFMFTHDAQLGRKLGVPFENDVGKVHSPLAVGEAQMIDWRQAPRAMLDAESALGPPRLMADPAGHLAFFFSTRENLGAASILLADGSRVSRMWNEPTLDGVGRVVGASVQTTSSNGTAGLAMHIRIRKPTGEVLFKQAIFADNRPTGTDRAVVWSAFTAEAGTQDLPVEVWFTREGRGRLAIDRESAQLPAGVQLGGNGQLVVLSAAAAAPPSP